MNPIRPKILLVYDDAQRPETTGGYCRSAFAEKTNVRHVRPGAMESPTSGVDLVVRIDDGQDYEVPKSLGPALWWAIDTHLNFDWYASQSSRYEHVFCAQKNGAERLSAQGVSASWLPLA